MTDLSKTFPMNDSKYTVVDGQFVNRHSGEAIPPDEPVFLIRARDMNAIRALSDYYLLCADLNHQKHVGNRILDFVRFTARHPERMKEPDTAPEITDKTYG